MQPISSDWSRSDGVKAAIPAAAGNLISDESAGKAKVRESAGKAMSLESTETTVVGVDEQDDAS